MVLVTKKAGAVEEVAAVVRGLGVGASVHTVTIDAKHILDA
jgi:hypothetical protein